MKLHITYDDGREQLLHQSEHNYIHNWRFQFHTKAHDTAWWVQTQTAEELAMRERYIVDYGSFGLTGNSLSTAGSMYGISGTTSLSQGALREMYRRQAEVQAVNMEAPTVTVGEPAVSHEEHLRAHYEARQQMLAAETEVARRMAQSRAEEARLEAERTRARTPWQRFRDNFR